MLALQRFFVNWYVTRGRDLPWRRPGVSPFQLLVAEIMLRQTSALNVSRVWPRFVCHYPSPHEVLAASDNEITELIRPLGLCSQKTNALGSVCAHLVSAYGGNLPDQLEALLRLPHVGPYCARAVLCFGFKQRIEVLDTNILRLAARLGGIETKADIRRSKAAWEWARGLLPETGEDTMKHNYGMLDFSAEVCRARQRNCATCPLCRNCHQALSSS